MSLQKKGSMVKNQNGSLTVFVVLAMTFFIIVLLSVYSSMANKNSSQKKEIQKIQEEYAKSSESIETVYENVVEDLSQYVQFSFYKKSDGTLYSTDEWTRDDLIVNIKYPENMDSQYLNIYYLNGSSTSTQYVESEFSYDAGKTIRKGFVITDNCSISVQLNRIRNKKVSINKIDKKAPSAGLLTMKKESIVGINYLNNTWSEKDIYISVIDGSDAQSGHKSTTYTITKGSGTVIAKDKTEDITLTESGTYKIEVTTEDNVGNTATRDYVVKIDKENPTIGSLIMKKDNSAGQDYTNDTWVKNDVYLKVINGTDAESGHKSTTYSINGGQATSAEQTLNQTGIYNIVLTTSDMVGNQVSKSYIVKIDKTLPEAYASQVISENKDKSTITINVADYESGVDYIIGPDNKNTSLSGTYQGIKDTSTKILIIEDKYGSNIETLLREYFTNVTVNENITASEIINSDYDVVVSFTGYSSTSKNSILNEIYAAGKNVLSSGNDSGNKLAIIENQLLLNYSGVATKIIENEITKKLGDTITVMNDYQNLPIFAKGAETWYETEYNNSKYGIMGYLENDKGARWIHSQMAGRGGFTKETIQSVIYRVAKKKSVTYVADDNKTYTFKVADKAGNILTKDVAVTLIDKTPPTTTAPTATSTTCTVTITNNQTDDYSQINESTIRYSIKKATDTTWGAWQESNTFTKLIHDTDYVVRTMASDKAGNTSVSAVTAIRTQKLIPGKLVFRKTNSTGEVFTPRQNKDGSKIWIGTDVHITQENGNAGTTAFEVKNSSNIKQTISNNILGTLTDTYTAIVTTTDGTNIVNNTYYIDVDKTNPIAGTLTMKFENTSGANYTNNTWTKQNVYIAVNNGTDSHSGHKSTTYTVNGVAATSNSQTLTQTGTYTIVVTTTDNVGRTAKNSYTIKIDKKAPNVGSLTMKLGNSTGADYQNEIWTKDDVYIALNNGTDSESGHRSTTYTINGGTPTNSAQTLSATGTYNIVVTTEDNAVNNQTDKTGNKSTKQYTINIDKEAPKNLNIKATLTDANGQIYDNNWTKKNVFVKLTATDNVGIDRFEWFEGGKWSTRALTTTDNVGAITYTTTRNATLRFRAVDKVGNISDEGTLVIKIDKIKPTDIAPTATSTTKSITVVNKQEDVNSGIKTIKYAIKKATDTTWGTWQTSNVFDKLTHNTDYVVKTMATDNAENSIESQPTSIKTLELKPGSLTFKKDSSIGTEFIPRVDESGTKVWINNNVFIEQTNGNAGTTSFVITNKDGVQQSVSNGILSTATGTYKIVLTTTDGTNTLTKTYYLDVDKTPPEKTAPTATSTTCSVTATFKQTDTDSGLKTGTTQYALKTGTTWGAWQTSNVFNGLKHNTAYSVKTKVTDNAGNTAESAECSIATQELKIGSLAFRKTSSSGTAFTPRTATDGTKVWVNTDVFMALTNGNAATTFQVKNSSEIVQTVTSGLLKTATGTFTATVTTTDGTNTLTKTYYLDIDKAPPTTAAPTSITTTSTTCTITVGFNQTDANSGINNGTKQYAIKKSSETTWGAWQGSSYFAGLTHNTEYVVKTKVTDNAGNSAESLTLAIKTKQLIAGSLTMKLNTASGNSYTNNTWTKENVYVTKNDGTPTTSNNGGVAVTTSYESVTGSAQTVAVGTTVATTISTANTTTLRVKTTDGTNNVYSANYIIKIDKTAPTAGTMTMKLNSSTGSNYENNTWTKESVYIAVNNGSDTLSGHKSTQYSVNGGTLTSTAQTLTVTGTYTIKVITTDNVGLTSERSYTVRIDKQAPTVGTMTMKLGSSTGANYTNATWTKESVYIAVNNGTDAHSGHKSTTYSVNGGTLTSTAQTLTETGTYNIVVTTTDNVGNVSTSGNYTIMIDKIAPSGSTAISTKNWTNKDVTITVDAADYESGLASITDISASKTTNVTNTYSGIKDTSTRILVIYYDGQESTANAEVNNLRQYFTQVDTISNATVDYTQLVANFTNKTSNAYNVVVYVGHCWSASTSMIQLYNAGMGVITSGNDSNLSLSPIIKSNVPYSGTYEVSKSKDNEITKQMKESYTAGTDGQQLIKFVDNAEVWYKATVNDIEYDVVGYVTNGQGRWIHSQIYTSRYDNNALRAMVYRASGEKSATFTVSTNGTYKFELKDNVGNTSTISQIISNIDKELPTITVNPTNAEAAKTRSVIITAADTGGSELATNSYQYYLSNSSTALSGGSWINYTSGQATVLGQNLNLNGIYYLFVKRVNDNAGNTSIKNGDIITVNGIGCHRFGTYKFDNKAPIWTYVSKTNTSTGNTNYIKSKDTITITFKGTDENYTTKASSSLTVNDIAVKVAGTGINPTTKTLTSKAITGGVEYTLTLSGIVLDGELTIDIGANTIVDDAGNKNVYTELKPSIIVDNVLPYWEIIDITIRDI